MLYDIVCEEQGAFSLASSMTGITGWAFGAIFAADAQAFQTRIVEVAGQLVKGLAALEAEVHDAP